MSSNEFSGLESQASDGSAQETPQSPLTRKVGKKAIIVWIVMMIVILPAVFFSSVAAVKHANEQSVEKRIGLITENYPVMSVERGDANLLNIKVKGTAETHPCALPSEDNLKNRATIFCEDGYRIEGTRPA